MEDSRYIVDECKLNMLIDYEDLENPDIDIYISGVLIAQIYQGEPLKFQSKIFLTDEGAVRLEGEMN